MAPPSTVFASCKAQTKSFFQPFFYDMHTLDPISEETFLGAVLNDTSSLCNFRKSEDVVEESTSNFKNSVKIEINENGTTSDYRSTKKEHSDDEYLEEFLHGPNLPSIPEHTAEESQRLTNSPSNDFHERCLHSGTKFIRQNSLPVEFYSYLGTKTRNPLEVPINEFIGNHQLHQTGLSKNSFEITKCQSSSEDPLLHQHSLPASELAQFSQDRDMYGCIPCLGPFGNGEFHSDEISDLSSQDKTHKKDGESPALRSYVASNTVICKSRAKRGCATHPRSIAERVRRTKISERMKRLYELLPNLDKQRHTAEMLDQVVEYVKSLQHQVQILKDKSCGCGRESFNS